MKGVYSHQWLQSFFDKPLPAPEAVSEGLLKHSFEIEEVRSVEGGDTVYELDILPNRSADCLAHYGIAKEIAAIFSLPLKQRYFQEQFSFSGTAEYIQTGKCDRYTILKVTDVALAETPAEIQKHLEAVGQRCIHPIVDLSNYILFDIGQPIHAFDARKVSGQFGVRQAKADEQLVILGGEEIALREDDVVITDADTDRAIALAGVKGGEETRVDEDTKEVYIEIASFNNVSVRRTMRRTGLISDAALRFSQGFPPELIDYTAHRVAQLFGQYGAIVDSCDDQRVSLKKQEEVRVSVVGVNALLGTAYTQKEIADALQRLEFTCKNDSQEQFTASIPIERPDIRDEYDMVEEVGRILGYDSVPSVPPAGGTLRSLFARARNRLVSADTDILMKRISVSRVLQSIGFSEVMTSSFRTKDAVCVARPVAKDKGCLRSSLRPGIEKALEQNTYNGELLGLGTVRVAEIGNVFTKKGEETHLALGARETLGRGKADMATIEKEVKQVLDITGGFENGVWEVPLEAVRVRHPAGKTPSISEVRYVPPSKYPFVLRDVAVFVPEGVDAKKTEALLRKNGGEYLQQVNMFDAFEKDGRQSYAFRMVFQSNTETLDDAAVNKQMDSVYKALEQGGYEVR